LLADSVIWDRKLKTPTLHYDISATADQFLYGWRTWYGQFYEGCAEYEKAKNALDW